MCRFIIIIIKMFVQELKVILSRSQTLRSVCSKRSFSSFQIDRRKYANELIKSYVRPLLQFTLLHRLFAINSQSKKVATFMMPDIGEGISKVLIKSWLVKIGDHVKNFDGLCEVECDKAADTIISPFDGVVSKIYYDIGDIAQVGRPLVAFKLVPSSTGSTEQQPYKSKRLPPRVTPQGPSSSVDIVPTLPSVRRLARENSIDLSLGKASGKHGRMVREDLMAYLKFSESPNLDLPISENAQQMATVVPLTRTQRSMFKLMTKSAKISHFNYLEELDLTKLGQALRRLKERNIDVSMFSFIIKMVSVALHEFPQLNASLDESGNNLVEKHYHNIGVAVDTKAGLLVPNIKNVERLTIEEIARELQRLRQLGYESKLSAKDLSGGTITLSNIGSIGGVFGVPVLVTPEILIGALGKARQLPRYDSETGNLVPRYIMQLCWSADHRVVDGATLSRFTNQLKRLLEEPESALVKMC